MSSCESEAWCWLDGRCQWPWNSFKMLSLASQSLEYKPTEFIQCTKELKNTSRCPTSTWPLKYRFYLTKLMHLESRKYVFHLGNMTGQDPSDKLINKTARVTTTFMIFSLIGQLGSGGCDCCYLLDYYIGVDCGPWCYVVSLDRVHFQQVITDGRVTPEVAPSQLWLLWYTTEKIFCLN